MVLQASNVDQNDLKSLHREIKKVLTGIIVLTVV
jgi:hypothetical protein